MNNQDLKQRTKKFALDVIALVKGLPRNQTCDVIGRQLLRSGTSVAANYRSTCRAKSPADFISKLGNVEEEADESCFWMEMLVESGSAKPDHIKALATEADELVAIMVASINTARKSSSRVSAAQSVTPHSAVRAPH